MTAARGIKIGVHRHLDSVILEETARRKPDGFSSKRAVGAGRIRKHLHVRITQVDPQGVDGLKPWIDAIGYHLARGVIDALKNGYPRINDNLGRSRRHRDEEHDCEE